MRPHAAHGLPALQHAPLCSLGSALFSVAAAQGCPPSASHKRLVGVLVCSQHGVRAPGSRIQECMAVTSLEAFLFVSHPPHTEPASPCCSWGLELRMAPLHADPRLHRLVPKCMLTQEFCAAGGDEAGITSRISSRPSQDSLARAASSKLSNGIGRFRVPDSDGPAAAVRLSSDNRCLSVNF